MEGKWRLENNKGNKIDVCKCGDWEQGQAEVSDKIGEGKSLE